MIDQEYDGCVVLDTSLGPLVIDLLTPASYRSVHNFVALVNEGFYDGDAFHVIHHGRFAEFGRVWQSEKGESDLLPKINPNIYINANAEEGDTVTDLVKRYPVAFQCGFEPIKTQNSRVRFGSVFSSQVTPHHEGARIKIALSNDPAMLKSLSQNAGSHVGIIRDSHETLSRLNSEKNAQTDLQGRPLYHIQIRNAHVLVEPSIRFNDSLPLFDSRIFRSLCRAIVSEHSKYIASAGILYDDKFKGNAEKSREGKTETKMRGQETLMKVFNTKRKHSGALPRAPFDKDKTLFVCRLNPMTTEDDLQVFFSQFGGISRCILACDKNTGDSLCYGFIEYQEAQDCFKAYKKTDGINLGDRHIHVDFYQGSNKSH